MSNNKEKIVNESYKDAWDKGCERGRKLVRDRDELRKEIAHRVRKCRLDARLTQEEISDKIDINPLTYKGYENCRSDIPTVYIVRIADFYGVSLDYLVGRADQKEPCTSTTLEERIVQLEQMMAELTEKND